MASTIPININGTIINFPASGSDPNWSPAVIQFAQVVQTALNSFVGAFDIPPQVFVLSSNVNTNVSLPNLSFPPGNVRGAIISYSVYRNTNSVTATETGEIFVNYNTTSPVANKWELSQELVGNGAITFSITDVGQVQFSTTSIAGTGFNGAITFQAKSILTS